ncbi:MAG: Ribonuclease E [Alphaproteobacteria bacterium MarineAlpha9_Bin6]|nr:MAG: Ribonuclease E [Alphaproteobacteria bacterium MarineAlpha9_Bin6]
MATKMLIDATHTEETRVAVVNDELLEEFDFETSTKKQNKGNIYLAKVTRVEPSLQAAFVDYGGNRQGFLAFNEIHPDYYQIPIDDRRALIASQKTAAEIDTDVDDDLGVNQDDKADGLIATGGDGEVKRQTRATKHYRIQEVIKRRQILLVQVNKEERGTKGAALSTYISLPGRYCVLMPNTTRGGGVSRKIESGEARRRLRSVVSELNVSEGMAVIVRTAGQERNKAEIKRDFDYLLRLWGMIRESTLKSIAPELIYEEANLIKRSIRDLYRSDFDGILVHGEDGYRTAKTFMRMMMPSRAKLVQPYRNEISLFRHYKIEDQLDLMHSPLVKLPSGGYLVINVTEALVAIDVNSGSATRERSIEDTAVKTNLEAAKETARQLKLRDLAGLIVVDFIDMEEARNNRSIERRLKDSFASDRARIQMGRISVFGLLELSRQRMRPSLLEVSSHLCPHCAGSGRVRSCESVVMQALRAIEKEGLNGGASDITISLPPEAAMYLLNNKRQSLYDIESRYGMQIRVVDEKVVGPPEIKITQIASRVASENTGRTASLNKDEQSAGSRLPRPARPPERRDDVSASSRQEVIGGKVETTVSSLGEQVDIQADGDDGKANLSRSRPRRRGRRGGRRRGVGVREKSGPSAAIATESDEVAMSTTESMELSQEINIAIHSQPGVTPDSAPATRKRVRRVRGSAKEASSKIVKSSEIASDTVAERSKNSDQNSRAEGVRDEQTSLDGEKVSRRSRSRVKGVRRRTDTPQKTNKAANERGPTEKPPAGMAEEALSTKIDTAAGEVPVPDGESGRSRRTSTRVRRRAGTPGKTSKATNGEGSTETSSADKVEQALATRIDTAEVEIPIPDGESGHSRRAATRVRQRTGLQRKANKILNESRPADTPTAGTEKKASLTDIDLAPAKVSSSDKQSGRDEVSGDGNPVQAQRKRGWWQRVTGS